MKVPESFRMLRASAVGRSTDLPGVTAVARIDRRTKRLTKRLRPGKSRLSITSTSTGSARRRLSRAEWRRVVNVAAGISGRYPNLGPQIIVEAGVPFVDNATAGAVRADQGRRRGPVHEGVVYLDDEVVGKGDEQTRRVRRGRDGRGAGRAGRPDRGVRRNTMEYIRASATCSSTESACPTSAPSMEGRHVLIVVRGYHYKEDIATLRPYIREYRPVLIGVDGGADALLEAGYLPDIIVGDFDSVSTKALTCGAELVVHAYRDGRAPGLERVHQLGRDAVIFPATGTSEDIAMLLADDKGAELIVAVGTHGDAGGVPRQGPLGHGQHLPHPAAGRQQARRRQGREPALPQPHLHPVSCSCSWPPR